MKPTILPIADRKGRKKRYGVRWRVFGRETSEWFETKLAATDFRTSLTKLAGEEWDPTTLRPVSWARKDLTVASYLQQWVAEQWPEWAANSRRTAVDGLNYPVCIQVREGHNRPEEELLRAAVKAVWLVPGAVATPEQQVALDWLERNSLPLSAVPDTLIRQTLREMGTNLKDGSQLAANTVKRRRQVYSQALTAAVESNPQRLTRHPLLGMADPVKRRRKGRASAAVEGSQVVDPETFEKILSAVALVGEEGGRYVALFALMYYAGLRPAEAVVVQRDSLGLPDSGWGHVTLSESSPTVGERWTDEGTSLDLRGLKWRSEGEVRKVPLPPRLVTILREYCDRYEAADGRLMSNSRGSVLAQSQVGSTWRKARTAALGVDAVQVPVPYSLRHCNASMMLSAGVPVAEAARRLGHSPEVLLRIYAHAMQADEAKGNALMDDVFGD